MKILSVNAGSSSLKFTLFEMPEGKELINGAFERIGIGNSFYTIKINGEKIKREVELKDHKVAIEYLIEELFNNKIITSLDDIEGIGHRVVQGGSLYKETTLVTDKVINDIESLSDLAPLHNPANVLGIMSFKEKLPNVPNTVVFDTAYHQTMDEEMFMYGVPYEWYENYHIRKYGFHGTSHRYIYKNISEYLNKPNLKVISCHIGNGSSIAAIKNNKVLDTSMGLTPLAGVMMGTRCGDIDPSIVQYIMKKENLSVDQVFDTLNKKSGFLGISGLSNDSRDIEVGSAAGNIRCKLTQKLNARKIANYIAVYNNLLENADVICFTAGIGENSMLTRKAVVERIKSLGVKIDDERNNVRGEFRLISSDDSSIPVYIVPTNEELMIVTDTYELIK